MVPSKLYQNLFIFNAETLHSGATSIWVKLIQ